MDKLWALGGALISVVTGWFLNELGQILKTRREDKKAKKKVLFYLLETYFFLDQHDSTKIERFLRDLLSSFGINLDLPQHVGLIKTLTIALQKNGGEGLAAIEENYKKSIEELSSIDPISAFRLRGKNKVNEVFDTISRGMSDVHEDPLNQRLQSDMMNQYLKPSIVSYALEDLEKEIMGVAKSIGWCTFWNTKKTLKRLKSKKDISSEDLEEFRRMFKDVLPGVNLEKLVKDSINQQTTYTSQ